MKTLDEIKGEIRSKLVFLTSEYYRICGRNIGMARMNDLLDKETDLRLDQILSIVIQEGKVCPVCKGEGYIYPNDAMKYDYSPSPNIKVLCNYCKGTRIAPTDPDITVRDAIEEKMR